MNRSLTSFEQSTLACRRQDADAVKQTVAAIWRSLLAGHDPQTDPMERAKLACQTRDVAVLRDAAHHISHPMRHAAPKTAGFAS